MVKHVIIFFETKYNSISTRSNLHAVEVEGRRKTEKSFFSLLRDPGLTFLQRGVPGIVIP